jgi:hypothetical protein
MIKRHTAKPKKTSMERSVKFKNLVVTAHDYNVVCFYDTEEQGDSGEPGGVLLTVEKADFPELLGQLNKLWATMQQYDDQV